MAAAAFFSKMIHAETVEEAVIDAVKETLLDTDHLRQRLRAIIEAESKNVIKVDIADLQRRREKPKKRTELIVFTLDEETLADAQAELQKLKAERRTLDVQIATASSSPWSCSMLM